MREDMKVRSAGENCMVFADDSRREVRVVYEPDGKPLFCASDLAACMGYKVPTKAVQHCNIEPKYRRLVPWVSKSNGSKVKRGVATAILFDKDAVEQFLEYGVPGEELESWVMEVLIPKAEAIGARRGYEYESPEEEPLPREGPPPGILERLDSIILEAVMLKKEIMRTT